MKLLRTVSLATVLVSALASAGTADAAAAPRRVRTQDSISYVAIMIEYGEATGRQYCLDAEDDANGNPFQNGDKVQMWQCSGAANQGWTYNTTNGTITNNMSGKCLDAKNDASGSPWNNGDKVQLWDCNGTGQQEWTFGQTDSGNFGEIQNDATLDTMCVDAEYDTTTNPDVGGDKIQLWQCSGQSQQRWATVTLI